MKEVAMFMHWMVVGCDVNGGDVACVLFQSALVDSEGAVESSAWVVAHRQEYLLKHNMRLLLCTSLVKFEKIPAACV